MNKLLLVSLLPIASLLSLAVGCDDAPAEPPTADSPPTAVGPAEAPAAEAPAAPADDGTLSCDAFITHMVELTASQGEEAFIHEGNKAEWIGLCEGAGNLNEAENLTIANCFMEADDLGATDACGNPRFMNRWAR